MRRTTITRGLGIIAGVLATVVVGPSVAVAAALDEANKAPVHASAHPVVARDERR
ncbi:hypothetical protein ACFXJ5_15060 [Streptomyces sp. NPDC059373]